MHISINTAEEISDLDRQVLGLLAGGSFVLGEAGETFDEEQDSEPEPEPAPKPAAKKAAAKKAAAKKAEPEPEPEPMAEEPLEEEPEDEDLLLDSVLSTAVGDDNYPGTAATSARRKEDNRTLAAHVKEPGAVPLLVARGALYAARGFERFGLERRALHDGARHYDLEYMWLPLVAR